MQIASGIVGRNATRRGNVTSTSQLIPSIDPRELRDLFFQRGNARYRKSQSVHVQRASRGRQSPRRRENDEFCQRTQIAAVDAGPRILKDRTFFSSSSRTRVCCVYCSPRGPSRKGFPRQNKSPRSRHRSRDSSPLATVTAVYPLKISNCVYGRAFSLSLSLEVTPPHARPSRAHIRTCVLGVAVNTVRSITCMCADNERACAR